MLLYSVFVYRSGYVVGGFFDIVIRIAHGYSDGCMAQHTDIVASITKCHCFFLSDTEMANDFIYSFCLRIPLATISVNAGNQRPDSQFGSKGNTVFSSSVVMNGVI